VEEALRAKIGDRLLANLRALEVGELRGLISSLES
jgi:hypothetical protein